MEAPYFIDIPAVAHMNNHHATNSRSFSICYWDRANMTVCEHVFLKCDRMFLYDPTISDIMVDMDREG